MTADVAIVIAVIALALAVIGLLATGAMAMRLRVARPPAPASPPSPPGAMTIGTLGQPVGDLLAPLIDYTVPVPDGEAPVRDMYLVDDGLILLVSTGCATCRWLVHESRDLLAAAGVRALVAAPTIGRGREFMERDCGADGVRYQVDVAGERARALGVADFPAALQIAGGVVAKAYATVTPEQVRFAAEAAAAAHPDGRQQPTPERMVPSDE